MEAQEKGKEKGLFASKDYIFLILAQTISQLGEGLLLLAMLTLVGLDMDATPLEMAMLILCMGVPSVLFGPLSGVLADKMERKGLMILSDVARAAIIFSLTMFDQKWEIYLLMFLKGTFEAIFTPAKNGKLKEIVADEHMDQAVGISTIIDYGSRIIAPAVGGLLVAASGTTPAFFIGTATFLLSALFLLGVPRASKFVAGGEKTDAPFFTLLKDGFKFIGSKPFLLWGTLAFSIVMFVATLIDAQMVLLFKELPGGSTTLFGMIMAAVGFGTLLTAGMLSQRKGGATVPLMALGSLVIGLAFGVIAFFLESQTGGATWWFPALAFVGGCAVGMVIVPFQSAAQRVTPEDKTSRVFGVINSMTTLATIVGPLLGGIMANVYGILPVFFVAAGLTVLVGLVLFVIKNLIERGDTVVSQGDGRAQGKSAV